MKGSAQMVSTQDAGHGRRRLLVTATSAIAALAGTALMAETASAGKDPLSGGEVKLTIDLPKGVTMAATGPATKNGHKIKLPVSDGEFDPVAGTGEETLDGGIEFRFKGNKAKAKGLEATWGSGGIVATIAGVDVKLFRFIDGTVGRNGFGGAVSGADLKLTTKGAQALNGKLTDKRKPMRSAVLGDASTKTDPETVEVMSGSADLVFATSALTKLGAKGVNAATGGVTTADGATLSPTPPTLTFPLTGGSIAPDGTTGEINAGGSVKLTKNEPRGAGCDAAHPVGTFVSFDNVRSDLTQKIVLVDATLPPPLVPNPNVPLADLSSLMTVSSDPTTRQIVVSASASTSTLGAISLQQLFGTSAEGCGPAGTDPAAGDPLGTLTITLTTH